MIASIKSRALKRFWQRHDPSGIRPDWIKRVRLVMSTLDAAGNPEELDLPGCGATLSKAISRGATP